MTDLDKLIRNLNRHINSLDLPRRVRNDIREAVVALKASAEKTYTGKPVKVPLTAEEKRRVERFTNPPAPRPEDYEI